MAFVVNVSASYNTFLLSFLGEGPLIHLMFSELKKLLVTTMERYIQADGITGKSAKALLELSPFEEKEKMLQFYISTTK